MLNSLTLRESEVLPLLAMGYSNKQIGDKLCISVSTVKVHVQEILSNLKVRNRIQAANSKSCEQTKVIVVRAEPFRLRLGFYLFTKLLSEKDLR